MFFRERKIQRAAKATLTKATKLSTRKALWRLLSRLLSLFPKKNFVPLCLCVKILILNYILNTELQSHRVLILCIF